MNLNRCSFSLGLSGVLAMYLGDVSQVHGLLEPCLQLSLKYTYDLELFKGFFFGGGRGKQELHYFGQKCL